MNEDNLENKIESNELTIKVNNSYFEESFFVNDFEDEKNKVRFIKKCESLIRSSNEYRNLMSYYKNELNFDRCAFLNKVHINLATIEIHHHPYTLYDIVEIIIDYHIKFNKKFNSFLIAFLTMQLHYENKIGLIPLSTTIHELAHNSDLMIPREFIFGDFELFYNEFKDVMDDIRIDKCLKLLSNKEDKTLMELNLYDRSLREEMLLQVSSLNRNVETKVIESDL